MALWMMPPDYKSKLEETIERRKSKAANQRAVYDAVNKRDARRCRGCGVQASPSATDRVKRGHHHHIQFRSQGGQDTTHNLALLCAICHHEIHMHRLTVTGDADGTLTFSTEQKTWTSEPPKVGR